jgi:RNA polymerase sigma-70 factor (ECF subfamily)
MELRIQPFEKTENTACRTGEQPRATERSAVEPRLYREIEALMPRLTRYARSLTHDLVDAEDLVQESLSRALAKIHLWRPGTDLRAWLFTIMYHQYVSEMRRAARKNQLPLGDRDQPIEPHQGKRLEFRDLARAFDALPSEQRSAIMLVAVDEMRYDEAASILNLPLGTVRSRVSRGRDTLRRLTDRMSHESAAGPTKFQAISRNRGSFRAEKLEIH